MMRESQAKKLMWKTKSKLGRGWTGKVWENLGWNVGWWHGAVVLHYEERHKAFWALVGEVDSGVGMAPYSRPIAETEYYIDPLQAVRKACAYAIRQYNGEDTGAEIIASVCTVLASLGVQEKYKVPEILVKVPVPKLPDLNEIVVNYSSKKHKVTFLGKKIAKIVTENKGTTVVAGDNRSLLMQLYGYLIAYGSRHGYEAAIVTADTTPPVRLQILAAFAAGQYKALFIQRHATEGVSLQTASRLVILDEEPESQQSRHLIHRVHRIGRVGDVTTYFFNQMKKPPALVMCARAAEDCEECPKENWHKQCKTKTLYGKSRVYRHQQAGCNLDRFGNVGQWLEHGAGKGWVTID